MRMLFLRYISLIIGIVVLLGLLIGRILWNVFSDQEIALILIHDKEVTDVAFSLDGRLIATSNSGQQCDLLIWDAQHGHLISRFSGCPNGKADEICSISFSPDGKAVAIAPCKDERIWFLDVESGKNLQQLAVSGIVHQIEFNSKGDLVLTVSDGGTVRVWDMGTQRPVFSLVGHGRGISDAEFSPDGRLIATASYDNTARIWDATDGEEIIRLTGHSGVVNDVEFDLDSQTLFTASHDGTLRQWDIDSGSEIRRFDLQRRWLEKVFYDPDSRRVVAVGWYSEVWIFDLDSQEELRHLNPAPGTWLAAAATSPDKSSFALAYGNVVRIWTVIGDEF